VSSLMHNQVFEETILSFPKEDAESEKQSSAKKKKEEPKKEEKKGKKKKELDHDSMRHEPPEYNIMASFDIDLSEFLSGESEFSKTLSKVGVQVSASNLMVVISHDLSLPVKFYHYSIYIYLHHLIQYAH